MGKLGCLCGNTIYDQTDNLSYKGYIIRDQDFDAIYENATRVISDFIEAIKNDKRQDWIASYFGKGYPLDSANNAVVYDILSKHRFEYETEIFQCEQCGRIKVEKDLSNQFYSFKPEAESAVRILEGLSRADKKKD